MKTLGSNVQLSNLQWKQNESQVLDLIVDKIQTIINIHKYHH